MTVASTPNSTNPAATREASTEDRLNLRQLGQQLKQLVQRSTSDSTAINGLVRITQQLTGGLAIVYYGVDSQQQLVADPRSCTAQDMAEPTLHQLYLLARRAQDAESAQVVQLQQEVPQVAVAAPVFCRDGRVEAMVAITACTVSDRRQVAGVLQLMQLLAAYAGQWRGTFDQLQSSRQLELMEGLLRASRAANIAMSLPEAAEAVAEFLTTRFSLRLAAIGVRRHGGTCRLIAISHQSQIARGAPLVTAIESALAERMALPGADAYEHTDVVERGTEAVLQLRRLMESHEIYRLLFRDGAGDVIAACLLVRDTPLTGDEEADLRQAGEFIGPQLARLKRTRFPLWQRWQLAFDKLTATTRRTVMVGLWVVAFILFAVPFPHRIKCRCEVQPVTRRFVAAPYEGRLQDALVEPGDLVKAGQVLAIMDGREIRLELSSLESELQRITKQRDRALANLETAAAQIALLEMQRLQTSMQLYRDRLENLEIRSPTDGVVISGDPMKLKGARLTIGQTLLEVGPLGEMVLELAIPDEAIARVNTGNAVRFRLDALPMSTLHGRLTQICPRSELRDGQNVFVGEVRITEDSSRLRPGMRGRAKLSAGHRSLFWLAFHRAAEHMLFQLGW
jgi:hypothetical protein